TSSASRRTSRPRSVDGVPLAIEQWSPRPQKVYISLLLESSTSMPALLCGALRIAIALIEMLVVPLVTEGLLGTTATSCPPFALSLYLWETWFAISLVIFATLPAAGRHSDHAAGALWPGLTTRTT